MQKARIEHINNYYAQESYYERPPIYAQNDMEKLYEYQFEWKHFCEVSDFLEVYSPMGLPLSNEDECEVTELLNTNWDPKIIDLSKEEEMLDINEGNPYLLCDEILDLNSPPPVETELAEMDDVTYSNLSFPCNLDEVPQDIATYFLVSSLNCKGFYPNRSEQLVLPDKTLIVYYDDESCLFFVSE